MLKNNTKRQSGFTIIEVLIVLAIAGLILLIVFLAVPALQRNARNTAIKNDTQNVLGGIGEFQAANAGALPTAVSGTGTVNYTGGTNATSISIQGTTNVALVTAAPATLSAGNIRLRLQYKCDGSQSTRAVAAYYSIETTTAQPVQCIDS